MLFEYGIILVWKSSSKVRTLEASAFINGDGVGKPKGILVLRRRPNFNQVQQVESTTSAVLSPDDMINLIYETKGTVKRNIL